MQHPLRCVLAIGFALLAAAPAHAQLIGGPATGSNCIPFGCGTYLGEGTRYQQVYAASNFADPFVITGIDFFQTRLPGGNLSSGTFNIYLSTTSAPVDGLSTDMNLNVGADQQLFGQFLLAGGPAGPVLSFSGAGFLYNPGMGNLLLDIQIAGIGHAGNWAYLDARNGDAGGVFSRMHNFNSGFAGFGLVTEFHGAQAVPEPVTVLLLGTGLVGLAGLHRRRRTRLL